MFCPNCGAQIPDDSAFCGSCGAKLGGAAQAPQQSAYRQPQAAQQAAPPNNKLSAGAILAIAAAAVVTLGVLLLVAAPMRVAILGAAAVSVPIAFGILRGKKPLIFAGAGVFALILIVNIISMVQFGVFEQRGLKGAELTPQTIIDNEIVTVRVTGLSYTGEGSYPYGVGMEITNHTDVDIHPVATQLSINGAESRINIFQSDIPAGQTISSNDMLGFYASNAKIKTIRMTLEFRQSDSRAVLYQSDRIELKTTLANP